jgi:hypothetical protein
MGSCFAQELDRWLIRNKYSCKTLGGVVYTPRNIKQIIQCSFEPSSWNPIQKYWIDDNKYYEPYVKSKDHSGPRFLGKTEEEAERALELIYERCSKTLMEADLVVITLGLTEHWRHKDDLKAFYRMPFEVNYDSTIHEFHSLSYKEVLDDLNIIVELFKKYNKNIKILFSISPVPLSATFRPHLGAYIATSFSKSILHAAAHDVVIRNDNAYYMPSYEIVKSNPIIHYKKDGRHVNPHSVNSIMSTFEKLYVKNKII